MSKLSDSALWYARRGWAVFPCVPGGKTPLTAHGFGDATTNEGVVKLWWTQTPRANIGIACGASGLAVIDVDVKDGAPGMESWRDLLEEHGQALGETVVNETPSGGLHMLYRQNGTPIRNSAGKLAAGIDVRGEGGYIVVPPSITDVGDYHWALSYGPQDREPAMFPTALLPRLISSAPATPVSKAGIAQGGRNETLASLAGTMRRRGMSGEAILAALLAENQRCSPPLPEDEVRKVAASIARYEPTPTPINLTDMGNARRFAIQHKDRVHYCYPWARWLVWDGRRWSQDQTGEIMRLAKEAVQAMYAEASAIDEEDARRALAKHALRSEAQSRVDAMLTLAQSEPGIALMPAAFDAQPWLFNCANGTVDLRTGELRPHSPTDMLTAMAPTDYDPEAQCPRWFEFQQQICSNDMDFMLHKQRAYGYALTGNTSEQCLFLLYGTGANGKSTELGAVRAVLGEDYALHTPTETLLANERGGGVPNDVARLRGARYVTAVEAESGRRLAEGLIKQMTGGDPIAARFMRAEWFEFMPTHKLFLAVNHKPIIRGQDKGIWRRIRLWPYTTTIPDDKQDKELAAKLQAEAVGILAWMIEGCLDWQKYGLGLPAQVMGATLDYQQEMDVLGGFVQDICIETPTATVMTKDLYAAYTAWCERNGEKAMTKTALGLRLQERGATATRDMHGRGWRGIGLLAQNPAVQASMDQEIKL